ncbi:MAG: sigma factor-like helix-turn-helix DNA-binding protein [Dehalococcoidales bacterium]|nr:sigma factor-like helix-turn-helix DNA-binding protein [Dehalococcoidales bacterium]
MIDTTFQNQLKDEIHEKLPTLTPREQRVIELRFGLEDGRERTLEEVGSEFNVTRQRICQIIVKQSRSEPHGLCGENSFLLISWSIVDSISLIIRRHSCKILIKSCGRN